VTVVEDLNLYWWVLLLVLEFNGKAALKAGFKTQFFDESHPCSHWYCWSSGLW
jgi:hypothetical protein